jgi:hypothetical protein
MKKGARRISISVVLFSFREKLIRAVRKESKVCFPIELESFINFEQPSPRCNRWEPPAIEWFIIEAASHLRGAREKLRFHAVRVLAVQQTSRACVRH